MGYKMSDFRKMFSDKVSEYLNKGYMFNERIRSLGNEVVKVDLLKGNECVRVAIFREHESNWKSNNRYDWWTLEHVSIVVGKYNDPTGWNDRLEIVERKDFYSKGELNDGYFVDNKDEAIEMCRKHFRRFDARHFRAEKIIYSEDVKSIVLPFVRRQPRCGRKKVEDIYSITRHSIDEYNSNMYYDVRLNDGKNFLLMAKCN